MKSSIAGVALKQIGSLLIALGIVELVPIAVSAIYGEWYSALGFLLSGAVMLGIGYASKWLFRNSDEVHVQNVLVVAASGWLAITLGGALPFWMVAAVTPEKVANAFIPQGATYTFSSLIYFKNYLHCFFESMSAYTTTGLSMAVHEPSVGKGVLFYRHFAQWVGGAGFIVMSLAVFKPTSGRGAVLLYGSESTGERLKPRVIATSRAIWKTYVYLTLFSTVYLFVGTWLILPNYPIAENIFDSINHAMAGQSTGGFSTLDDSIATYHSVYMDMLYLLPMIIGSFSIPFFYKVIFEQKFSEIWNDLQTRALIIAFAVGGAIQSYLLFRANSVPSPVREGVFQFISAMSTTGWQTSNMGEWDWLSVVFIVGTAMFIGGASGATVGGIKMVRALLIQKVLRWQVTKTFLTENTVKSIKFNGKSMSADVVNEEFTKAATMAFIFLAMMLLSSFVAYLYLSDTFSFSDALIEAGSAQGTVGLSSGITDPSMPPVVESIYIFQMWAGRLEIIPILALIRAIVFGTNPQKIH